MDHKRDITALAISKEGDLISGSVDRMIKFWNIESGACIKTLQGHQGSIEALIVISRLDELISASSDGISFYILCLSWSFINFSISRNNQGVGH